jgi:hypothetical protein
MSTERHEASHAACAILLGRCVEHVERNPGLTRVGEELGHAWIPVGDRIELSQLAICLVGYTSVNTPGWPPSYEDACTENLEALGKVITILGVDEQAYDATVELVSDMLADQDFKRLRDAIARALSAVPRLEAEDIQALCAIHLPQGGLT